MSDTHSLNGHHSMPHAPVPKGNFAQWFLYTLAAMVLSAAIAWLNSVHTLTTVHGERISVIESQMLDQRRAFDKMDHRLEGVDKKIDRIMEMSAEKRKE